MARLRWLSAGACLGLLGLPAACGRAGSAQAPAIDASRAAAPTTALPQSRTAAGYHVLGRADAPVTIENYSDFL